MGAWSPRVLLLLPPPPHFRALFNQPPLIRLACRLTPSLRFLSPGRPHLHHHRVLLPRRPGQLLAQEPGELPQPQPREEQRQEGAGHLRDQPGRREQQEVRGRALLPLPSLPLPSLPPSPLPSPPTFTSALNLLCDRCTSETSTRSHPSEGHKYKYTTAPPPPHPRLPVSTARLSPSHRPPNR